MNTSFLTGVAGSGKSYSVMEEIRKNPKWGLLTSTTGISAINLGTITLNAALGYFDTKSLRELQYDGKLLKRLREIKEQYDHLVIDEVSMMDGDQLTIITEEADKVGLGIYLTGDFLQLPPVKAKWAFESPSWKQFDANTTRLTKVWRQSEGNFLNMLNLARSGSGEAAASIVDVDGGWHDSLQDDFDGTTLISKNAEVDQFNWKALDRVEGKPFRLTNRKWGRERGEWKNIPPHLDLKVGAYVMILSNKRNDEGDMIYANGDCGHVVSGIGGNGSSSALSVRLVRNQSVVTVERVLREVTRPHRPKPWFKPRYGTGWLPEPHWDFEREKFVEGQLENWPLRLAYASTIHKSQGLSLDRVQLDFTDPFCGQPAMLYTGMSRCRTFEGLRLVGSREKFIENCRVDQKVRRWL